jgi:hypothetical protein
MTWALGWSPLRTLRVLAQDMVWIGDGRNYQIDDMEPSHADNVLAGLDRQAAWLASQIAYCALGELKAVEAGGLPQIGDGGPTVWLHDTPLYRRLAEVAAAGRTRMMEPDPWAGVG